MLLSTSGVRMPMRFCPVVGQCRFARRGRSRPDLAQRAQRADGDVLADRPEREDAVGLAVAGDEGDGRRPPRRLVASAKDLQQHLGLAMAGKAGEADDLALAGDELRARRPCLRPGADDGIGRRAGERVRRRRACAAGLAAHGGDQRVAGEVAGRALGDDLAVAHHHDAVGGPRISPRRCEIRMTACRAPSRGCTIGQELLGGDGVERRGRLVEDDKPQRLVGHGEGAGDLDHLALADGEVGDSSSGVDAVAGKDLVELGADQLAGALPPAEALEAAGG